MGMKGVFESWRSFSDNPTTIDEQLVIESRYTDAVASTTNWKKIVDKPLLDLIGDGVLEDVSTHVAKTLKEVSAADPSGKNKYLPWFANVLKKHLKNSFDRYSPRLSGRAEEIVAAGEKPFGDAELANLLREIDGQSAMLLRNFAMFHKYMERGLIKKTLEELESVYDVETAVHYARREEERRDQMERLRAEAKSTTTFLEDNDDYTILRPESAESSCYFGQGTTWCISATTSQNYFDQYTGEGHAFYFVTFKHVPQEADDRQLALVYRPDDHEEPSEVFDRPDDDIGVSGLQEAANANFFYKALNQMKHFKGLKKKDPERYTETAGADFFSEVWDDLLNADAGAPLDQFWREWASHADLHVEIDKIEDMQDLSEAVQEAAMDEASAIIGETGAHHQDNPGGPNPESFEKLYNQYDYRHLWVHWDEYDAGAYYWNAGWSIEPDVEEDAILDEDNFAEAVRELLDDNYMYPDEIEWDSYDKSVRVTFTPDHNEGSGTDGFSEFLSRMADYDEKLGQLEEEDLMNAYVEHGAVAPPQVKAFAEMFEKIELDNFEVEYDKEEVSFTAQLRPRVQIPQWILDTPDPPAVLTDVFIFLERHPHTKKLISDRVIGVVEDNMESLLAALTAQLELPLGGEEEAEKRQEKTWEKAAKELGYGRDENVNVGVYPRADSPGARGGAWPVEEEGDKKFIIPRWFLSIDLLMNLEPDGFKASEEDAQIVMKFAQYLDNRDVFEKIQELLKVTIEKALANVDFSQLPDSQYTLGASDVQEQQIQEIHKLLNPSHAERCDIYKEKAEALMREVFSVGG